MEHYKKTLLGSVAAFFIGTSCCWLSSLALWLGGAGFIGLLTKYLGYAQIPLIAFGGLLMMISVYLFRQGKKRKAKH